MSGWAADTVPSAVSSTIRRFSAGVRPHRTMPAPMRTVVAELGIDAARREDLVSPRAESVGAIREMYRGHPLRGAWWVTPWPRAVRVTEVPAEYSAAQRIRCQLPAVRTR